MNVNSQMLCFPKAVCSDAKLSIGFVILAFILFRYGFIINYFFPSSKLQAADSVLQSLFS